MNTNIPIWVINLAWSEQRRLAIEQQLQRLNLNFEFFNAVDGYQLAINTIQYSKKQSLARLGRPLHSSEIGCALSHITLWQRIIDNNIPYALILEDDALIGQSLLTLFENIAQLEYNWEALNLLTDTDVKLKLLGEPVFDNYRIALPELPYSYITPITGYLLTKNGAEKLLRKVYPLRWTIDGFMGRTYITDLAYYSIFPPLLSHNNHNQLKSTLWRDKPSGWQDLTLTFRIKLRVKALFNRLFPSHRLPELE